MQKDDEAEKCNYRADGGERARKRFLIFRFLCIQEKKSVIPCILLEVKPPQASRLPTTINNTFKYPSLGILTLQSVNMTLQKQQRNNNIWPHHHPLIKQTQHIPA